MKRIICIGNRYIAEDCAGFQVFESLSRLDLPADIELIDGGLGGLNLLRFVDGATRVVFVDNVSGFGEPGRPVILDADEVSALADEAFAHGAGLPYLLKVLPRVCDHPVPKIAIVGIEEDAGDQVIEEAAALALSLASDQDQKLCASQPSAGRC
jgi:hydrogenase maturation protease